MSISINQIWHLLHGWSLQDSRFLNKEDNVLFTVVITGYKDTIHNWGIMTGPIWQHWFVQHAGRIKIIIYSVNTATHRFILLTWLSICLVCNNYDNNSYCNWLVLLMTHIRCNWLITPCARMSVLLRIRVQWCSSFGSVRGQVSNSISSFRIQLVRKSAAFWKLIQLILLMAISHWTQPILLPVVF